jgi:hypothetical protein
MLCPFWEIRVVPRALVGPFSATCSVLGLAIKLAATHHEDHRKSSRDACSRSLFFNPVGSKGERHSCAKQQVF